MRLERLKMIKKGELTVIDFVTYTCLKVEDGKAYLKDITSTQGRPKIMDARYVPYFTVDGLVTPEKPEPKQVKISTKLNLRKLIKGEIDLPVTNDAIRFLSEWAETAICQMISWAEENATRLGHDKITAAHIYWWSLHPNQTTEGFWSEQKNYSSRVRYERND